MPIFSLSPLMLHVGKHSHNHYSLHNVDTFVSEALEFTVIHPLKIRRAGFLLFV